MEVRISHGKGDLPENGALDFFGCRYATVDHLSGC